MDVITKRRLFYISSILLVLGLVSSNRLIELHTHWTTPADMDMGYPLLIVFIYFYHRSIKENQPATLSPYYLVPLALVSCTIYLSSLLNLKSVFFLQLPLLLAALTGLFFGSKTMLKTLAPIGIVAMALPFWYAAIMPLQSMTVWATSNAIDLMRLTAFVEGNYITLPSGTVHVAGGCSGLKYLLSAITISLISSALNRQALIRTILFAICAATLAILANWVRVISLVGVGYYEGTSHPLMTDHDLFGWIIFGVFIAAYFFIDRNARTPLAENSVINTPARQSNLSFETVLVIAAFIVVASPSMYSSSLKQQTNNQNFNTNLAINISSLNQKKDIARSWYPDYPDSEHAEHYSVEQQAIRYDISIMHYFNWGENELAKTTNSVFPNEQWWLISDEQWTSDTLKMRIAIATNKNKYRAVYYWYDHQGKQVNSILQSKIQLIRDSLKDANFAALVAISHQCSGDCKNIKSPPTWLIDNIRNESKI